jgi:hypothetical protein
MQPPDWRSCPRLPPVIADRHMISSDLSPSLRAQRSNPVLQHTRKAGLLRYARNDADIVSRSRGLPRPRFARNIPPSPFEGAGKTGCFPHPRSRVPFAQWQELHTSIQVQAEHPGLPCAMALRLASRSSRRTALLPPSPALPNAGLAPAPRRPNHATSPYAPGACVSRA